MKSNEKIILTAIIGALAGVIVGLFAAPDKGSKTAEKLSHGLGDIWDDILKTVKQDKAELEKEKEEFEKKAQELKEKVESELHRN